MNVSPQLRIPATYIRGGTSKGVFFLLDEMPPSTRVPGPQRDAMLLRVIGSPDPYGKHTDGMGGATSSTSKVVILSRSSRAGHDVDYLFGQVPIDASVIDWSGNCGNLSAAVGAFAVARGLVEPSRIPRDGIAEVRIWQANIGKTIVNHVPMAGGEVQESGDFELDGVTFPAAEVRVDFLDPSDGDGALLPTGNLVDRLEVPGIGTFDATMISAGIPTIFLRADALGYLGTELQENINNDAAALQRFETIRAHGAVAMGLIDGTSEAATRQHTPKIAFVAPPRDYTASSGRAVNAADMDLLVRALSMGKLHHAMMGTVAVSIAAAAALPGSLVNQAAGGGARGQVTFGHPSGTLRVGAEAVESGDGWNIRRVSMSRSQRVLMEGRVRIPADVLSAA